MENKLPETLNTNEEVKAWEEHLNKMEKHEVIGFMLDKMIMDNKFFDQVRLHFCDGESNEEYTELIAAFDNEINLSYKAKDIDTEFVIAITRHFMRMANSLKASDKSKAYNHMADVLVDGIEYHSLGYPDDEFEVNELIDDLRTNIL